MSDPQRRRTLVLLGGAVAALVLLAGGLPSLQFGSGDALPVRALLGMLFPPRAQPASPAFFDMTRLLLLLIFWVATPIVIVALVVSREFRRQFLRMLPTYIIAAIVIYLLLRVVRDMMLANTDSQGQGQGGPAAPPADAPGLPSVPEFVSSPPQWLIALITLVIVALIGLLLWWLWPRSRGKSGPVPLDQIVEEAEAALDDLRAGADLRDTVLRCYAEMVRVLHEARGLRRGEGMTAREFEGQLRAIGVADEHVGRLTRLFERVRYGSGKTSPRDAREAEACLFALVQSYGKVFS